MSKKQRKPIVPPSGQRAPAPTGPAGALQDALRLLRLGRYGMVQEQVGRILRSKLEPRLEAAAREVLAEAHFRAAVSSDDPGEQLSHLDAALQQAPGLRAPEALHRGLALWRAGRLAEALVELDATAARSRTGEDWPTCGRWQPFATGKAWDAAGLTPAEANTLRLVQRLARPDALKGSAPVEAPLLGKGTELWQALAAMHEDPPRRRSACSGPGSTRTRANRSRGSCTTTGAWPRCARGDREGASKAWLHARSLDFQSAGLIDNLTALERGRAVELAEEGQWQAVAELIRRLPASGDDRITAETGSLAHFHLGYEAAEAGKWSLAAQHWRKANDLGSNRYLAQNLALAEEALENWSDAAEAWRDMVRRRPRKEDHPDYLTDAQVAALWNHAAECYEHAQQLGEVETCLRNAVKYAPDDTALRLRLADFLLQDQRGDAAETQLQEIIALERKAPRGAGAPGPALRGVVGSRSDDRLATGAGDQPGAC